MIDRNAGGLMRNFSIAILMVLVFTGLSFAQPEEKEKKPGGMPPALVKVADITEGEAQPMSDFIGTVYYPRVSDVAAEVSGRVGEVKFEGGRRVKKGATLVILGSDILDASIASTEASYGKVLVELERARKDLKRIENLFKEESIAESVYDEYHFKVKGLEYQAQALEAELERLSLEKDKKVIMAPFGGVVIEKSVEVGEWLSPGGKVAVVARDSSVDIIVNVPQHILGYLKQGSKVKVKSGGEGITGTIRAFIPRGDVATRTFPVKIRAKNPSGKLKEGMEASAVLPSGGKIKGLLVHRDAVIKKFGMDVVFVVMESKAKMIPVGVVGYHKDMVGIAGPGLGAGMKAVVKGNERIMDGQPVQVIDQ
jgi:RND family efflux transporter MFP subunit